MGNQRDRISKNRVCAGSLSRIRLDVPTVGELNVVGTVYALETSAWPPVLPWNADMSPRFTETITALPACTVAVLHVKIHIPLVYMRV